MQLSCNKYWYLLINAVLLCGMCLTSVAAEVPAKTEKATAAPKAVKSPVSGQAAVADDEELNFEDYLIGPSNLLEIKITQDPDLSRTLRVDGRGEITMPLIGAVRVQGLTAKQVEEKLALAYGKDYIRNPEVIVSIREYTSLKISVQGNVLRPGIYNMAGKPTLMESISLAGGLTEKSNIEKIRLVRASSAKAGNEEVYDFEAIKSAKIADPVLENNDTVFVDESVPIIVEGSVVKPGILYAKPQTTLMQVISLAGGLRELADSSSIIVYGAETAAGRTSQKYDLERIREGKDPDPKLTPGNVVVVEESTGKAILYTVGRTVRGIFSFTGIRNPVGGQ